MQRGGLISRAVTENGTLIDQLDERLSGKETPVVLQGLPDDFHHALLPGPVRFSFEGICRRRDSGSLVWSGT